MENKITASVIHKKKFLNFPYRCIDFSETRPLTCTTGIFLFLHCRNRQGHNSASIKISCEGSIRSKTGFNHKGKSMGNLKTFGSFSSLARAYPVGVNVDKTMGRVSPCSCKTVIRVFAKRTSPTDEACIHKLSFNLGRVFAPFNLSLISFRKVEETKPLISRKGEIIRRMPQ